MTRVRLEIPPQEGQIPARLPLQSEASAEQESIAMPILVSHQERSVAIVTEQPTLPSAAVLPVLHFGMGAFEAGQQESILFDQRVTKTCVVQIMLLNDPGPVVVHYVSLQPQLGFTAHLTAPALIKTPFNYLIFVEP
jgi:hypothetical protein